MADRRVLTEKRIGVLMGGQSSEREVSLRTGERKEIAPGQKIRLGAFELSVVAS